MSAGADDRGAHAASRGAGPQEVLPDQEGPAVAHRRAREGRRRRVVLRHAGRGAGAGRRERLRQDDDGTLRAAADRADRREREVRGARDRRPAAPRDARAPPPHADHLSGSVFEPESATDRRQHADGGADDPSARARPGRARPRRRAADARRTVAQPRRALPARVLGRPAPAHRRRARARGRSAGSSSPTSRSRRSTSRSRRRSSTCCAICSGGCSSPMCSSRTICRSSSTSATASR